MNKMITPSSLVFTLVHTPFADLYFFVNVNLIFVEIYLKFNMQQYFLLEIKMIISDHY